MSYYRGMRLRHVSLALDANYFIIRLFGLLFRENFQFAVGRQCLIYALELTETTDL